MKETMRKEGKDRTGKGRWWQDEAGIVHYRGVCPFNNAVCRLRNAVRRRTGAIGGADDGSG